MTSVDLVVVGAGVDGATLAQQKTLVLDRSSVAELPPRFAEELRDVR